MGMSTQVYILKAQSALHVPTAVTYAVLNSAHTVHSCSSMCHSEQTAIISVTTLSDWSLKWRSSDFCMVDPDFSCYEIAFRASKSSVP